MTMGEGGAQIGAASFGVGLDLAQLERDLARAEQMARASAQRIQQQVGAISASPQGALAGRAPVAATGAGSAHAARPQAVAAATSRGSGARAVPPFVTDLFNRAVADGMSEEDARRSLAQALGIKVSDLAGLGTPGASRVGEAEARRAMRVQAQRAQRDARLEGRPFSVVSTGQLVGPRLSPQRTGLLGALTASPGTEIRAAGAFFGVGLGLSAAVGAATALHNAIEAGVRSAVELARAGREVGISFGAAAGQRFAGPGASAFLANPTTRGTASQFLQEVAGLGPLAKQYGLTADQVQRLGVAEGQLAQLHNKELPQAGQVLQAVLRGNVEAGQALDLQLLDQYGRLKDVGLSFDELTQSVGRTRAEQILAAAVIKDVDRQLHNAAAGADVTTVALNDLGKQSDVSQSRVAASARPIVAAGANYLADILSGRAAFPLTPGQIIPEIISRQIAQATLPRTAAQSAIDQAIAAQNAPAFANEQAGGPTANLRQLGADRGERVQAATEQAARAGIQARLAQSQLDTLGAQSDLRRLGVQGQLNEVAQARLDIEGRLAPILLEQQQVQDRITLSTRENLDLTEQTLRAQRAAVGPQGVAADLSFAQQRIRLLAQVQQSRAIRGLGPAAGIASIPELFGQAYNLALAAPEINLAAGDAAHAVDVAQRAQAAAQIGRQLGALPDQRRLQQIQNQTIPLQQAEAAAKAAADAIERSLQGADLVAGPARIKAEQDLAASRLQQADAAAQIARAQSEIGGPNINANATVTIEGLTDVQAVANQVLDAFRPQLVAAINAAINNPRPPSAPPTDRGNR